MQREAAHTRLPGRLLSPEPAAASKVLHTEAWAAQRGRGHGDLCAAGSAEHAHSVFT